MKRKYKCTDSAFFFSFKEKTIHKFKAITEFVKQFDEEDQVHCC